MKATENKEKRVLDKAINSFVWKWQLKDKHWNVKKEMTFSDFLSNKMLIVMAIKEGIPYSIFDKIQSEAPFSRSYWCEALNISVKSLDRYHNANEKFKPIHSEKIIELAEVTEIGKDVFGSMNKFKLWLETPNYALGKLKPLDLLKDSYGKEMVVSELTRIDHGILA